MNECKRSGSGYSSIFYFWLLIISERLLSTSCKRCGIWKTDKREQKEGAAKHRSRNVENSGGYSRDRLHINEAIERRSNNLAAT